MEVEDRASYAIPRLYCLASHVFFASILRCMSGIFDSDVFLHAFLASLLSSIMSRISDVIYFFLDTLFLYPNILSIVDTVSDYPPLIFYILYSQLILVVGLKYLWSSSSSISRFPISLKEGISYISLLFFLFATRFATPLNLSVAISVISDSMSVLGYAATLLMLFWWLLFINI